MQTKRLIPEDQIDEILASVFASGDPLVKEAYSQFDTAARTFSTLESLREDIQYTHGQKQTFFYYTIYYPEARGFVLERRIELKPGAAKGHTHRFVQEGWGLICLHLTFKRPGVVECCVSVNSETRARNWADTFDRLRSPDLWDWRVIERHARRLTRVIRKLAQPRQ